MRNVSNANNTVFVYHTRHQDLVQSGKLPRPQNLPEETAEDLEEIAKRLEGIVRIRQTIASCFQQHHIITRSICKADLERLTAIGFNMNNLRNLVTLPTVRLINRTVKALPASSANDKTFGEIAKNASLHNGRHSNEYVNHIRDELNKILELAKSNKDKLRILYNFINKIKRELINGKRRLSAVDDDTDIKIISYARNSDFLYIRSYFQVHHIIPQKVFKDKDIHFSENDYFKTIADALVFVGFQAVGGQAVHCLENLCSLPAASCLAHKISILRSPMRGRSVANRSPHNGSHPIYDKMIKGKLADIFKNLDERIAGIAPSRRSSPRRSAFRRPSPRRSSPRRLSQEKEKTKNEILKMMKKIRADLFRGRLKLN